MEKEIEKTIKTYNLTAEQYHEETKDLKKTQEYLDDFSKLLPANAKILDVGCGPGRDAKLFSEKGFNVTGIDLSESMLRIAKKIAPKAKFKIMDLRKLDFEDKSFDVIWFVASLLHIKKKDARRTLNEMYRVLKPEGVMALSVKKGKGEGLGKDNRYSQMEKYRAYYTKDELKKLLENAGFKIIKIELAQEKIYVEEQFIIAYCKK
ncbi:MAG: class I SAM-dependent methyltransferase [Candidatus Woesearchaeota archaeon]